MKLYGDSEKHTKKIIVPSQNKTWIKEQDNFDIYEKERGIKKEILKKFDVQFQKGKFGVAYVYQYFDDKGIIFNRKYKFKQKNGKNGYMTEKDALHNFYGIQFLKKEVGFLIVCEGEDDCHALVQMGFENVVSVDYGAGNFNFAMKSILRQYENIYLMFDNDTKGQDGAKKFADNAGSEKCKNIVLPKNDARECLLSGVSFDEISILISTSRIFDHPNLITGMSFMDNIDDEYYSKDETLFKTGLDEFDKMLGGIRAGELTVLTGSTGTGKSTLGQNFIHFALKNNISSLVFCFENKIKEVKEKMVAIRSGKRVTFWDGKERVKCMRHDEYVKYSLEIGKSPLSIYKLDEDDNGYCDTKKLVHMINYAARVCKTRFVLIDHLHYFLNLTKVKNAVATIDEAVRELKQLANRLNIHIVLIAHPHMTNDDSKGKAIPLGLNSLKGSSAIAQESDNFIVIEKGIDEFSNITYSANIRLLKNRIASVTGSVEVKVNKNFNNFENMENFNQL